MQVGSRLRALLGATYWALIVVTAAPAPLHAEVTPSTQNAFNRYVELTEQRMTGEMQPDRFLWLSTHPDARARVRKGEIVIVPRTTLDSGKEVDVPGGLIQHWLGSVFIPNTNVSRVRDVMQDYANYRNIYRPEVIDSRLDSRNGDQFDVFLRLYKRQIVPVVLNANYRIHYGQLDAARMYIISRSTRIAEVKDPRGPYDAEMPIGNDDGFLWRLNSYWRFQEADGGVYAECEAISLSRDVPLGLGWMLRGFIEHFPKDSMEHTLAGTRKAVLEQAGGR
jgi:hypothetical protein